MPEVSDVWLLGVVLTGESTFWLCEPTHLKPLAEDWKAINCRWLYPVVENVCELADVSGFESTDVVYEVDWMGTSKVLRPATLAWNVRGKRQKVGSTTYVFVPAEEVKQLDEAFKRFVKLEATMKPPPRRKIVASLSDPEASANAGTATNLKLDTSPLDSVKQEEVNKEEELLGTSASFLQASSPALTAGGIPREVAEKAVGVASVSHQTDSDNDGEMHPSSVQNHRAPPRRSVSSLSSIPSHKRHAPHRGTTIYQAPVSKKPTGSHCSGEAFEWSDMYVVHRGSVDYLCPQATGNTYGFRLDRVMHDGFPVFLLFFSSHNNSESIDPSARGVPVFEKAKLSGEGGEGAVRNSVLVLTRLSSKKHQSSFLTDARHTTAGRRRRRRRSDDDSSSDEDESGDEDGSEFGEMYEEEEKCRVTAKGSRRCPADDAATPATHTSTTAAGTAAKVARTEAGEAASGSAVAASTVSRRGRKKIDASSKEPLQAVSVNFWTDPQQAFPTPGQLAKEFPFVSEDSEKPQTVVFSDGVCVTYTASTAAKHSLPEKKRKAGKHSGTAAFSEDADLNMLNEHILNAFAQVRKDSV